MTCKHLHSDWCHKDPTEEEIKSGDIHQEKCYWHCYGKVEDCPNYEGVMENELEKSF